MIWSKNNEYLFSFSVNEIFESIVPKFIRAFYYDSFYSSISSYNIELIISYYIIGLFIFNENSRNFLNNSFLIPKGKSIRLLLFWAFKFCRVNYICKLLIFMKYFSFTRNQIRFIVGKLIIYLSVLLGLGTRR